MNTEVVRFRNTRGMTLVGDLLAASDEKIVVMSHGLASDRHGKGRLPYLADALAKAGIATLRFDFAGCGESDDDTLTTEGLRDDLISAVRYVQERGFTRIGLYGHSLGGTISLNCFSPEIGAVAVTGTATGPVHYNLEEFFPQTAINKMRRTGVMPMPSRNGQRPIVLVSQELMDKFESFTVKELPTPITIPVLLVHGDGDDEERMLLNTSREGLNTLPAGSVLRVFEGAPHDMHAVWPQVADELVGWFRDRL